MNGLAVGLYTLKAVELCGGRNVWWMTMQEGALQPSSCKLIRSGETPTALLQYHTLGATLLTNMTHC